MGFCYGVFLILKRKKGMTNAIPYPDLLLPDHPFLAGFIFDFGKGTFSSSFLFFSESWIA